MDIIICRPGNFFIIRDYPYMPFLFCRRNEFAGEKLTYFPLSAKVEKKPYADNGNQKDLKIRGAFFHEKYWMLQRLKYPVWQSM